MPPVKRLIEDTEVRPNIDVDDLNGREHEWVIASVGHKHLTACWYYEPAMLRFIIRDDRSTLEGGYPQYFKTLEEAVEIFNTYTNED